MAKFLIEELQHVVVAREIDASDRQEALQIFYTGGGAVGKRDSEITGSELLRVVELYK